MSADKFLVTTKVGKGYQSKVWDASAPMPLGHPMRWILERTAQGARFRDLSGREAQLQTGKFLTLGEPQITEGAWVSLPSLVSSTLNTHVQVKRLHSSLPAYLTPSDPQAISAAQKQPLLYAYSGVRRSLTDCNQIHSAYVAHYRGKPAFTLYHTPDGLKIRVLLSGLRLKHSGKESKAGKAGEQWVISNAELASITLYRGWSWWRFNLVQLAQGLVEETTAPLKLDAEESGFKKSLIVLGAILAALSLVVVLLPSTPEKPLEMPLRPQPVKIFSKKKHLPKQAAPDGGHEAVAGAPAAAPAPAIVAAAQPATLVAPPRPATLAQPKAPTKSSAQIAAERTKLLRDAFKGIAPSTQKDAPPAPPTTVTKSLFSANKAAAPSEIQPLYNGSGNGKVQGIGGKGLGGAHGDEGTGKGYGSSGAIEGLGGKGGSFAAIGDGGGSAEEGLSMEEIGAVIQKHMDEVRYCHEADLIRNPKSEGKLVMDFKIAPNGKVEEASTKSSTLPGNYLEKCLRGKLLTWKFPLPKGGVHVGVTFPFVFKTLETR